MTPMLPYTSPHPALPCPALAQEAIAISEAVKRARLDNDGRGGLEGVSSSK